MSDDKAIREILARSLAWGEAHVSYDDAVKDLAPELRGVRPPGFAHSAWELIEHLRLAQSDLLEFSAQSEYQARKWPEEYWPAAAAPPSETAWDESIAEYRADRAALQRLVADGSHPLTAVVPAGKKGETYLREFLLALDHASYHLAQLVSVRQALGAWRT